MRGKVFEYARRITFAETDGAGIAHFSRFSRWVEEAETAFWRVHGVEVPFVEEGRLFGFPKVSFSIRYRAPVRCGEEIGVEIEPQVLGAGRITWGFRVKRGEVICAAGKMVVVFAQAEPLRGGLMTHEMPEKMLRVLGGVPMEGERVAKNEEEEEG
ncbi:MAG: acyl-CoA thioesterase [Puniceicoccales bacterium]|jgi:acyl-CoA thioesterase FadM|nr:acyl-CoA thioesterase [Puniceicoccales bacterium]